MSKFVYSSIIKRFYAIKRFTYILLTLLGIILLVFLIGYFVLQNKKLQHSVVDKVTKSLSVQVGSEVSIDEIEWNFPNSFILKNVYVEDQQRDTMLFMDRTKVTINLWKLFSSQISFRTVQFTGLDAHLSVDSTKTPNFQFFVDAFKSDNDTLSIKWSMDIESLSFNDCSISYINPYAEQKLIGRLNPNDLKLRQINGCLYVRSFTADSVQMIVEGISAKEQCGLVVDDISTTIGINRQLISVEEFDLKSGSSNLNIERLLVYHDNYESFKDPLNKLRIKLLFSPSTLVPSDFAALRPQLEPMKESLSIEGGCYGCLSHFQVHDLDVRYGTASCVSGNLLVRNVFPVAKNVSLMGSVDKVSSNAKELGDILYATLGREVQLPAMLDSLGEFSYSGTVKGDISDMKTVGQIASNLGSVDVKVTYKSPDLQLNQYRVTGDISSKQCYLNRLFGSKSQLGNVAFRMAIQLDKLADRHFSMVAKGDIDSFYYRNYCYQDVNINGTFDDRGFDGSLVMDDENAEVSFSGKVDLQKEKPLFHFVSTVNGFNLTNTHLVQSEEDTQLSLEVETNFVGNTIEDLEGTFSIDNILFVQGEKEVSLNNFSVSAVAQEKGKKLSVFSDYINGYISGKYNFTTIPAQFQNLLHQYLPVLVPDRADVKDHAKPNDFTFDFTIENMEPINEAYQLPVVVVEDTRLTGFYNDSTNKVNLRIKSSQIKKGKSTYNDFIFVVDNPRDALKMICRATYLPANKSRNPYFCALNTSTKDNQVDLDVSFSNSVEQTYSGKLDLKAVFKDYVKGEGVTADFSIRPSNVILNDTIWEIKGCEIAVDKKNIEVDSFLFSHGSQFLAINGRNSATTEDSINLHFSDLHLGYISDILANKNITFDGVTDGDLFLFRLFNSPFFRGNLYVYDAAINGGLLGDMSLSSQWLEQKKCIDFDVKLLSLYNEQLSKSTIHGGVFLGDDSLFIGGHLKDVSLKFLRKYLANVMQNNTGTVSGDVKAYGKFGHIGLEGKPYVRDMAFNVDYLKTSFVLSDTVILTPHTIELNQTQVFDPEGNYGVVSGMLLHDSFRNFKFAFSMDCNNLLMMNTKEEDNETFYGKAYVNGRANISGVPELVNFDLNLQTRPNTLITVPIGGASTAKDDGFITFVHSEDDVSMAEKKKIRREKLKQLREQQTSSPTTINLSVNVEATPDAQVHLIMDAQQGDIIRANGQGNLQMYYNSKDNNFKMYGGYEITKGDYLFTIQSIISRKFDIMEGSTVQWTGTPYNANINVKAKYGLSASLNDIIEDPDLRTNTSQVNCLMNLTGTILQPVIKFDIDLPNSDDDVRSKLKSVINTEEAMNRNIASLLALGHFYNMDKSNASMVATNELSSVGFSTLSSQLTNWISKINQDISIGLNYRPTSTAEDGTITATEFDVALSTQLLNDRLLFSGNFGYRDEVTGADNISNSIVDFDIEYKINKSGKLRTKVFNRSNNSYFKQAPNTQGLGIVYREDFDTFSGMIKDYWNAMKRRKKKNTEEKK